MSYRMIPLGVAWIGVSLVASPRAQTTSRFEDLGTPSVIGAGATTPLGGRARLFGDVDGDRRVDVVFSDPSANWIAWAPGLGTGGFGAARLIDAAQDVWVLALGDLDGDGRIELVGTRSQQATVWTNTGGGQFAPRTLPVSNISRRAAAMADVDADGDLDVLLSSSAAVAADVLLRNDGAGNLADVTATHMPAIGTNDLTNEFAVGDVDGDGDLDVVVARAGNPFLSVPHLLRNDGTGRFVDVGPFGSAGLWGLECVDLDLDGDPDLVTTVAGPVLLFNDGTGGFGAPQALRAMGCTPTQPRFLSFDVGDYDGDGDPDLVAAVECQGLSTTVLVAFENDGAGNMTQVSGVVQVAGSERAGALDLLDVDGDDDVDLLLDGSFTVHTFANVTRHLDTPREARLGARFDIDSWAAPGHVSQAFFSFTVVDVELPPFGRWTIDPLRAFAMPVVSRTNAGRHTYSLTIPNDTGLRGLVLYGQMIDAVPGTALASRFSNRTVQTIR